MPLTRVNGLVVEPRLGVRLTFMSQVVPIDATTKGVVSSASVLRRDRASTTLFMTPVHGNKSILVTASGPVGEEVVGCRIKVWWALDRKFYKGTIMCFDHKYKIHQVDYDDGEIEILDLTRECWMMLQDDNLAAHDQKIDADSSSSKVK
ncbi:hypothetical protein C2S51_018896 [Perilla frutescens var. frutescens]|nr:hypothetical protein C2S51_018896 [Perilla frutescens var. frutescens]